MAVEYLQIIMGGLIFNSVTIVINAAQRGAGMKVNCNEDKYYLKP